MSVQSEEILARVKQAVRQFDPEAEIVLYGSRARGDTGPESDWDFLVLLGHDVDYHQERRLKRTLYEIEWETGEVITSIIHTKAYWEAPELKGAPLVQSVEREGIRI